MKPLRSALLGLALSCTAGTATANERLTVYAVNAPLAAFAERLAGDHAEVVMPVPPGRDPAFWRPSIADISAVQSADLILLNGAGYAQWTTKTSLPRAKLVDSARGFADAFIVTETITHSHGPEGEHSHQGIASHTWLDFAQAAQQAEAVANALSRRLPGDTESIATALTALKADLTALDARARSLGERLSGIVLIASHPRYQYFARAYGLAIESLEWEAGETPSPDQWLAFDDLVADSGARAVIWEGQPSEEAAVALAARGLTGSVFATGANRGPGELGFIALMQQNLEDLERVAETIATD